MSHELFLGPWIRQIFLILCGFSFGVMCSAGVFTVLVSVGLVPRFAGRFHIANHILFLEEMVVWGTLTGGFFSIFSGYGQIGDAVLKGQLLGFYTKEIWNIAGKGACAVFGIFSGMFVGCLALAIAEMLDSIPIFARRTGFRKGIGIVILLMAFGKLLGSLVYFSQAIFAY